MAGPAEGDETGTDWGDCNTLRPARMQAAQVSPPVQAREMASFLSVHCTTRVICKNCNQILNCRQNVPVLREEVC